MGEGLGAMTAISLAFIRVYRVSLTSAGRACWAKIHPLYLQAVADITRGLSEKQMRETWKTLVELEAKTASLASRGKGGKK